MVEIQKESMTFICGRTGCGKTTLLLQLKKQYGTKAGYVMQNPDNQIVADTVRLELMYGLANLGLEQEEIFRRIAETASYFGISRWLNRKTDSLSGGEKQIVNLAAAMALAPEYLLLDEPTSMLDPVLSERLLRMIGKIHRELATTIIIAEHRPEELFFCADQVIFLEQGKVLAQGTPQEVAGEIQNDPLLYKLLPYRVQLQQGEGNHNGIKKQDAPETAENCLTEPYVIFDEVRFSYEKHRDPVLQDFSFTVFKGEILAVLGENGCGKTTFAKLLAGALKPYSGKIRSHAKRCAMLFQDVTVHFTKDEYDGKHPYDYSGGEQQLLALSLLLQKKPDLLILDEPTKGLDAIEKERLSIKLKEYQKEGMTIIIITHDIVFAAETADRMGMLFDGKIAACEIPEEFCEKNVFYTAPDAWKRLRGWKT